MTTRSRIRILAVDDEFLAAERIAPTRSFDLIQRRPDEVTLTDLERSHLVLVDYALEKWRTPHDSPLAHSPANGLALAAVMRSQLESAEGELQHQVAFALRTGRLAELAGSLSLDVTEHAFARAHNLEWAFPKQRSQREAAPDSTTQIRALAAAVRDLPRDWSESNYEASLDKLISRVLMQPARARWSEQGRFQVQGCHPPIAETSRWSKGVAVLRWLLHRILPYPCFLFDEHHLAARLRVPLADVRAGLQRTTFRSFFRPVAYTGLLSEFLGPRWWRAGVEWMLWRKTDGEPHSGSRLRDLATNLLGREPTETWVDPVVVLDDVYRAQDQLVESSAAVRVQLEDWPAYAEAAWTAIDTARDNPALARRVVPSDRQRLDGATHA